MNHFLGLACNPTVLLAAKLRLPARPPAYAGLAPSSCCGAGAGGPALQDDVVVGVAFQNLPGAENIGTCVRAGSAAQGLVTCVRECTRGRAHRVGPWPMLPCAAPAKHTPGVRGCCCTSMVAARGAVRTLALPLPCRHLALAISAPLRNGHSRACARTCVAMFCGLHLAGYIIPTPVVYHFLSEVIAYGSYQVGRQAGRQEEEAAGQPFAPACRCRLCAGQMGSRKGARALSCVCPPHTHTPHPRCTSVPSVWG